MLNLSNYMRELYQVPGIAETVKPRYYVMTYYRSRAQSDRIIPKGTPVDFRRRTIAPASRREALHPNAQFLIAGRGRKRADIEY